MHRPAESSTPQLTGELTNLLDGSLRVEDFVATVVHEAAQPLTAIEMLARALRTAGESIPLEEREQLLQDIENQARFLRDLANWMLRPFARETGKFDDFVMRAAERCGPLAPEHQIVATPNANGVVVTCEPVRLEASIRNLVKNSAANAPAGSEIVIGTSAGPRHVIVSVSDVGSGIPKSEWKRVFRPYTKLEGERSVASGLGLFIAHSFALQHGGFARVAESGPGGTTIELTLSVAAAG